MPGNSEKNFQVRTATSILSCSSHRLLALLVKASASRATDPDPWFDSRLRRGDFSGSNHTLDLKIGRPGPARGVTVSTSVSLGA